MRRSTPSILSLTLSWALVGGTALCGAMPQESKMQRPTPTPQAPAPSPRVRETSTPLPGRTVGTTRDPDARLPRPGIIHRTMDQDRPGRVNRVSYYPGTRTVVPPPWTRCSTLPTPAYWRSRDIMAEIQWMSRRGFIPVSPVGDSVDLLSDYVQTPAGWRAYGISVPAGGTVQVEVKHSSIAWFRLMMVDKWGSPGPGMLQASIAHQPVMVTYKNPKEEAQAIYVIVDDPAWWSDAKNPYTLAVRRDWDPAKTDLSQVKMVAGLWGASPSVSAEFRGPSLSGPAVYPR